MTLDQLEVFKTVAELGSFRSAAEKLNRAQSAVSYAIKHLEDEFGFALFDRNSYRPSLTSNGEGFLKKVQSLLIASKDLENFAKGLSQGAEPQVRIAVSALFPLSLLLPILNQFSKQYPQTDVKLVMDILGADKLLLQDQADLALTEVGKNDQTLESIQLFDVEMISVCSNKHPLANTKTKAQKKDLISYPQIVIRSSPIASERTAGVINESHTWSVTDFAAKKELLLAGLGWGYMPKHMIDKDLISKKLVMTHTQPQSVKMHFSFKRDAVLGPATQFLARAFQQL